MEVIFNFLREIGACYKIWSVLKKRLCEMLLKIFLIFMSNTKTFVS